MNKRCPYCGQKLYDNDDYCLFCGKMLRKKKKEKFDFDYIEPIKKKKRRVSIANISKFNDLNSIQMNFNGKSQDATKVISVIGKGFFWFLLGLYFLNMFISLIP